MDTSNEQRENEHIRHKIESLTQLPAGYQPDLNSKWDLLEAALPLSEQKPKRRLFIWRAAAAIVVLMAAISIWITRQTATDTRVAVQPLIQSTSGSGVVPPPAQPAEQLPAPELPAATQVRPDKNGVRQQPPPVTKPENTVFQPSEPVPLIASAPTDSTVTTVAEPPVTTGTGSSIAAKRPSRPRRYVEFTFGDTTHASPEPMHPTARQAIQIRLGHPVSPASKPAESAIRLRF